MPLIFRFAFCDVERLGVHYAELLDLPYSQAYVNTYIFNRTLFNKACFT